MAASAPLHCFCWTGCPHDLPKKTPQLCRLHVEVSCVLLRPPVALSLCDQTLDASFWRLTSDVLPGMEQTRCPSRTHSSRSGGDACSEPRPNHWFHLFIKLYEIYIMVWSEASAGANGGKMGVFCMLYQYTKVTRGSLNLEYFCFLLLWLVPETSG